MRIKYFGGTDTVLLVLGAEERQRPQNYPGIFIWISTIQVIWFRSPLCTKASEAAYRKLSSKGIIKPNKAVNLVAEPQSLRKSASPIRIYEKAGFGRVARLGGIYGPIA